MPRNFIAKSIVGIPGIRYEINFCGLVMSITKSNYNIFY